MTWKAEVSSPTEAHNEKQLTRPSTMATTDTLSSFVLPGEALDPSQIPTHKKKALQIGPGLRHIPPSTIVPTVAGQLVADPKKNSLWVE